MKNKFNFGKSSLIKKVALFAFFASTCSFAFASAQDVIVETAKFKLVIRSDATAKSLIIKKTGEECVDTREGLPLFTSTQERPFNNETKLIYPHKRITYTANRIRREGDLLIVGFDIAPYEALIRVKERGGYALFTLEGFRTNTIEEKQYKGLKMDVPPVVSFRVLQLPVKKRANFGEWLNVEWDDRAAVAVVASDPYSIIDHEKRFGFKLLNADLLRSHKLYGGAAVLAAGAGGDCFLESVAEMEEDLDLPRGVKSRRHSLLNASIYWTYDISPKNVDEHIAWAKRGGFRMMLIYYTSMLKDGTYEYLGDYDWNSSYPNGIEDLKKVLSKIKAAGITPGFHTLQTHIGLKSRYVTPDADPRLNKTMLFTLAKPLPQNSAPCEIEVLESTAEAVRHPMCKVLQFGGELFTYEWASEAPPWKFYGVKRGHCETRVRAHARGEIGGIVDISEYGASSCYIDQRTDLQDEIAQKIAKIYDAGMAFCYFDGSEGVNPPCAINVSLSQLRVVDAFKTPVLFTEGAAKSHFGWHLQSGANAFDTFMPEVFKEKIVEYPLTEAPIMRRDFTRIDFGWWGFWPKGGMVRLNLFTKLGTQRDMWEYGTSKAAAWDCPATIQATLSHFKNHKRTCDIMETMRRWEVVRERKLLTASQKEMLKNPSREFHLVLDGKGGLDLVEWHQLNVAGSKTSDVRAFTYEHNGKRIVEYWHISDSADLLLPNGVKLAAGDVKEYEISGTLEDAEKLFNAATIVSP